MREEWDVENERELKEPTAKRSILSWDRQPALFSLNTAAPGLPLTLPPLRSLLAGFTPVPSPQPSPVCPPVLQHIRLFFTNLSSELLWSASRRQPQSTFRSPGICFFHHSCSSGSFYNRWHLNPPLSSRPFSCSPSTHLLLSVHLILPDGLPNYKPPLISLFPSRPTIPHLSLRKHRGNLINRLLLSTTRLPRPATGLCHRPMGAQMCMSHVGIWSP